MKSFPGGRFAPILQRSLFLFFLESACSHHSLEKEKARGGPPASTLSEGNALLRLSARDLSSESHLPVGWEPYQFEKIPQKTEYRVVLEEEGLALRAKADSSASALRRKVSLDPKTNPLLEWTWKVERPIEKGDIETKEGDDCAARIMILYRYDPAQASILERAKFESARTVHGEYPPAQMLVYAWTGERKTGDAIDSPYSDRVKVVPVEMGAARAGKWVLEKRDHLKDFRQAFGQEPSDIEAVAIMVDTDNTHSQATAWFRDLRFLEKDKESRQAEPR